MVATKTHRAIIAVNRFGLGASGNELSVAQQGPEHWLLQQLVNPVFDKTLGGSDAAFNTIADLKASKRRSRERKEKGKNVIKTYVEPFRQRLIKDSLSLSVNTQRPFAMRLLDFFSNHFSVSGSNPLLTILAPTLEREAIAPNLFGQFADLLIAVEQHPAMLIYLNNEKSVGPNSKLGKRSRGLNENLAREILELHTLGQGAGYGLDDIRQLALAISGWSIVTEKEDENPGFKFRSRGHEPGVREVLGKRYIDNGQAQGQAVLRDLAHHKKTAQLISYKLAQHLIADNPPKELVAAMTATWVKTEGNIKAVVTTLVQHPQSWQTQMQKFKTPREFVVSAIRAVNNSQTVDEEIIKIALRGLGMMGQKPFSVGSPAGYSQLNRDWEGSDALMKRIDWVNLLCKRSRQSPQAIAGRIFDSQLSPLTVKLLAGVESRALGLALLLLSPEFQRR
jgi:uncharacterized protein (DUF1800 family)